MIKTGSKVHWWLVPCLVVNLVMSYQSLQTKWLWSYQTGFVPHGAFPIGFWDFVFGRPSILQLDSFAFPLHVQQVFFVDDGGSDGWKIVLRGEPQSCTVLSKVDGGPYLQVLQVSRDAKQHGLRDICTHTNNTTDTPMLAGCRVLIAENVSKALEVMEYDLHCVDNVTEL